MKKYKTLLICNALFFVLLIAYYFLQIYLSKTLEQVIISVLFLLFSFFPLVIIPALGFAFALVKLFSKEGTGKRFLLLIIFNFLTLIYLVYASLAFYYWLFIAVAINLAFIVIEFIAWKKYPRQN